MQRILDTPPARRCRVVNVSSVGGKFHEPLGAWRDSLTEPAAAAPRAPGGEGPQVVERGDRAPIGSKPDVVAKKIVSVVLANTPHGRYPVDRGAGTVVRARRLLPDAALDHVVKGAYGMHGRSRRR